MSSKERFWSKVRKSDDPNGCWLWQAGTRRRGYGRFWVGSPVYQQVGAHRYSYELAHGPIPDGFCVCHSCDTPGCVNPAHLWTGTQQDNTADRDAKARMAKGDRNGARLHPERLARGDKNGTRLHPERLARGDKNGARLHPENMPRGDRNGSHTRPERRARGDRNGTRLYPERVARGEQVGNAKLTEAQVREIRARYAAGGISQERLGADYGVCHSAIGRIVSGKVWAHLLSPQADSAVVALAQMGGDS